MERAIWWKLLAAILFLIILTMGLLTPLKHGLVELKPSRLHAGKLVELEVFAYNSLYLNPDNEIRVFLRPAAGAQGIPIGLMIEAKEVKAISSNQLKVLFEIPDFLPERTRMGIYSLIVDSSIDGAAVIPAKAIIQQDSINFEQGIIAWSPAEKPVFNIKHDNHFPYRNILVETIRSTFFHVSLWFAMFLLLGLSVYNSFRYLKSANPEFDLRAYALVKTALFFGVLGCITGSLWARFTWETWWTTDIKLNMAALSIMIYLAYIILRAAIEDLDRKRKISAAYNIFALVAVIPLIFVLPRLTDSLHPGNGGNPAFASDDMDNSLRLIFYPSVIAFILIGLWMASLLYRIERIQSLLEADENNF